MYLLPTLPSPLFPPLTLILLLVTKYQPIFTFVLDWKTVNWTTGPTCWPGLVLISLIVGDTY